MLLTEELDANFAHAKPMRCRREIDEWFREIQRTLGSEELPEFLLHQPSCMRIEFSEILLGSAREDNAM